MNWLEMLRGLRSRKDGNAAEARAQGGADRAALERRMERGVATSVLGTRGSTTLDVVLGIDFGTSSTKIVARLPYDPGAPAFAVAVMPSVQAEKHPHMWKSRLWLRPDGTFSLVEEQDAASLGAIKANLMKENCERSLVIHAGDHAATALECATAFLTLQIRQARGWLQEKHGPILRRGPLRWHYNLGLPAAKLDEYKGKRRYQACLGAALLLAGTEGVVTLDRVRSTLAGMVSPEESLQRYNASLQPEIAAAVAGFARSRRREDGLYAMVDVGAGTMDCCTFSLLSREGEDRCPIFAADVSMLGMQVLKRFENEKARASSFREGVNSHVCSIIRPTKMNKFPVSPRWSEGLPLFLVGGGNPSEVHRSELKKIDRNMRKNGWGGLIVQELPAPEHLQHASEATALHRLAVAVGLSLPAGEIPSVELPSTIGDIPPSNRWDYERQFIDKDQV